MDAAPGPAPDRRIAHALGRRRKRVNAAVIALCMAATAIGLAFLASILFALLHRGLGALGWGVFVNPTRPPGGGGGLANAIAGSLIQSLAGTLAGAPVGLLAGTWLAEYARDSFPGHVVRFVSDVLLSAPSILIGLFIYIVVVIPMGGFSGIAGSLALAVIVIPIVLRTTEDMLRLVPDTLREAVIGLGAPKWKMITLVSYRAVRQGIATGVLLAIARVAGETAPLLFTSLGNLNWSLDPGRPMASLPVTIYNYAGSAFAEWVDLAWTGALLITAGVLALNIAARVALRDRSTDTRR